MAPKNKLTAAQIAEIRALAAADPALTQAQLADRFDVGRTTIANALGPADPTPSRADSAPSDMLMLCTADILLSPLNPRKTFDENAMAELIAGIEANGLLQNLVVRPAENGFYSLVAGERRFRAIRWLEENGRWNAKLPCRVITANPGEHLAMALLENLARQDVPPMEEAEAFVQLHAIDKSLWSTTNIAARIGKSTRYVQQRMSLVTKLAPAIREAVAAGTVKIEAARLLTTQPPKIQEDILKRRAATGVSAADIKWEIRGTLFEVADAIFDVAVAGLDTVTIDGDEYFEDSKAAKELQMQAVKAKAESLKKLWGFVKVLKPGEYPNLYQYHDKKTKKDGAGCIIAISYAYEVTVHTGLLKKPEPARREAPSQADYEAQQMRAIEQKRAEKNKRIEALLAVTQRLPTDYEFVATRMQDGEIDMDDPVVQDQKPCALGCKYQIRLDHPNRYDGFIICGNPASPRAGLLTFHHQAGGQCFEGVKR